jgi:hypothetical protein
MALPVGIQCENHDGRQNQTDEQGYQIGKTFWHGGFSVQRKYRGLSSIPNLQEK